MRRFLGCCGALAVLILVVNFVSRLAEESPPFARESLLPTPALDLFDPGELVPVPEPRPPGHAMSPYEWWLTSFGPGTHLVEVSTENCPPCLVARRDLIPPLERAGWNCHSFDDHGWVHCQGERHRLRDLLQSDAYPVWLLVRNGVELGRYVGADRTELAAFLRSGKGPSLEALGVALVAHVGADPSARETGRDVPYRAFGPPPVRVFDLVNEFKGQTLSLGDVATLEVKDLAWQAQRLPDAVRLEFTSPPSLTFRRWVFWSVTLDALVVRLESVTAELGGFPDFRVPVEW